MDVFIVLPGRGMDWGIDAQRVRSIVAAADWLGPEPVRFEALFQQAITGLPEVTQAGRDGARPGRDGTQPGRVLLIDTRFGPMPMIGHGRLSLRSVERSSIQPLPKVLRLHQKEATGEGGLSPSGVVLSEGRAPLVILSVEALCPLGRIEGARRGLSPGRE